MNLNDEEKMLKQLQALRQNLEALGAEVDVKVTRSGSDVIVNIDAVWVSERDPLAPDDIPEPPF